MKMDQAIHQFCEWRELKFSRQNIRSYKACLVSFCFDTHNPDLTEITLQHITNHFQTLRSFGYVENGLLVRAIALRKFFQFLRLTGHRTLHEELISIPRRVRCLPRVADEKRYLLMMAVIPKDRGVKHVRDLAMLSMLWDTGARCSEILSLQVEDLDLKRMGNIVRTKKSQGLRPFRCIFWTKKTNERLKRWLPIREQAIRQEASQVQQGNPVFISIRKHEHVRIVKPLKVGSLSYITRQYCRAAGVEPLNPHSFRHYMGHKIINDGGSNSDVMNILGHSTLTSSMTYTMMAGKELENRYRKFRG